ncbi:hypothetical protein JCM18918_3011 [Cutibacterium acnes JCM 18918]|nr:hypothetical protein JCM18918_3011 [Cutibacterium acnes JCM 18918]
MAGRNNDLRTLYSHWTGQIRKSRLGVLLVPDADYDGDLLDVRLPRHPAATVNKGTLKYSLTYRTIKQPLSGDVLEVVTSARSCLMLRGMALPKLCRIVRRSLRLMPNVGGRSR